MQPTDTLASLTDPCFTRLHEGKFKASCNRIKWGPGNEASPFIEFRFILLIE